MIDIHCHLMYGVDDGPDTIEESIEMLANAAKQGIDTIFLTPHYRKGMFPYDTAVVDDHFKKLQLEAEKLGIQLYIGCEYHVNSYLAEYYAKGRCHSLGDGRYILAEYEYDTEFVYIRNTIKEIFFNGYIPIVVHPERYACLAEDIKNIIEIKSMGGLIQCNADAVLGLEGRRTKRFCKRLMKNDLIDMIASDSHGIKERTNNMMACYNYVEKKYSREYADALFGKNQMNIVDSAKKYAGRGSAE